ncbi:hypothetical protein PVN23_21455 [Bacillus licheniformis]|uniref:hypothetical protein n=1 Tax=Bacillus licheniformis TaxID=1402 RepID=UPI00237CBDE0|nr:hypothetical protein [Bacillus licheniformis]MDE1381176.1 hypothetical protein [Bacillus licheniformis]
MAMTESKYTYSDFEKGQVVRHSAGFIGEVVNVEESILVLRVERHEDMTEEDKERFPIGHRYLAHPRYVDESLSPTYHIEAKEGTTFIAEFGAGIKFEGTKTDFEAFIKGFKELLKMGVQFR